MERSSKKLTKSAWSWALYDWANSAFATTIMAGFFPIFFKSYWASDLSDAESTFAIGSVNSIVGLLIAFSAPVLGALADAGNSKRKFLFSFAFLGILTTGYLFFIPDSSWKMALIFYGLDGFVSFSLIPLRFILITGIIISFLSFLFFLFLFSVKILHVFSIFDFASLQLPKGLTFTNSILTL